MGSILVYSAETSFMWLMWVGIAVLLAGIGIFLIGLLLRFWWLFVLVGAAVAIIGAIGWLPARNRS